jgi:hypothetical protein
VPLGVDRSGCMQQAVERPLQLGMQLATNYTVYVQLTWSKHAWVRTAC